MKVAASPRDIVRRDGDDSRLCGVKNVLGSFNPRSMGECPGTG